MSTMYSGVSISQIGVNKGVFLWKGGKQCRPLKKKIKKRRIYISSYLSLSLYISLYISVHLRSWFFEKGIPLNTLTTRYMCHVCYWESLDGFMSGNRA